MELRVAFRTLQCHRPLTFHRHPGRFQMDLKSECLPPTVEDRISALPDPLRCHILSFLETKCAVRTSILSTRWKNTWASVTSLHFLNMNPLNDIGFNRFVNGVLLFRNSLDIRKFRLNCSCVDENRADIDTWICSAIRHNVVELDLSISNFSSASKFGLPKCLFTCKTVVVLKLNLNALTSYLPKSGCFPSLKFINVTAFLHKCNSIENLSSHWPVLEHLIIDIHAFDRQIFNLNISAPKLKSLKISLSRAVFNVCIKSPKLENLGISESISSNLWGTFSNYYLYSPKSLVKASIDLKGMPSIVKKRYVFLAEISGVKDLSLSAPCLEACELPAFDNLNKLKLYDWELLGAFLQASPNLEDLVLEIETKSDEECIEHQWNPPELVPKCLLSHLKTVFIRGFKGQQVEMEAAQYLLKNVRALKKMTIYTEKDLHYIEEKKLLEDFLMFEKTCLSGIYENVIAGHTSIMFLRSKSTYSGGYVFKCCKSIIFVHGRRIVQKECEELLGCSLLP